MSGGSVVNVSVVADLDRDEELARAEVAILAAMFVITVSGNSAVLFAIYARKYCVGHKKLSRMYYFILHLCVADLSTALLNVFPQMCWKITYRFRGGPVLCKVVKYGQTVGPYLSSYILVATAVDRYKAVCDPLTYCARSSRTSVAAAWLVTLAFCVPQVVIFSYQEIAPGVHDCWATFPAVWGERIYVTWYSVSVFLVPLCVLIYTYFFICWTLWRYAGLPESASPHMLISRAKINTIKQTVAVIVIYIACSSPFICAQLWAVWLPQPPDFFDGAAFTILTLLSSLNSCVNPWIYLCFNRELVGALRSWRPRRRSRGDGGSTVSRRLTVTEVTHTTDTRRQDSLEDDERCCGRTTSLKTFRPVDLSGLQDMRSSRKLQTTKGVRSGPML